MWSSAKEFKLEKSKVEELVHEPVKMYTVDEGCNEGDGVAGSLMSIKLTTESGKELHLVYKEIDKTNPEVAQYLVENGSFVIENTTYSTLIPKMTSFATSRGLLKCDNGIIPTPKLYDSYKGNNPIDSYICMEDIRTLGFKMANKYIGLTLDEVSLVMKEIAKFHAIGYAFIKDEGEKIFRNEFAPFVSYCMNNESGAHFVTFPILLHGSLENSVELVATRDKVLAKKMEDHFQKYMMTNDVKILHNISFETDEKYFPVFIHGDLWSNNFMFKYDKDSRPIAIKFFDFQLTRRGNIFEDLVYLILTSTTPKFRHQNLLNILNVYYNEFVNILDLIKVPIPVGFTKGKFLDLFYENLQSGFRYLQFAIPLQLGVSLETAGKIMMKDNNHTPPPSSPESETMEQKIKEMVKLMKIQVECEKKALDRLVDVAQEMADLKFI